MLQSLTVSNIVLIERLTLNFERGLTVLTGETGAGKSILLDSLGLALGSRANFGLIREGANSASVTASFHLQNNHPVWARLEEADISIDDTLILRRRLKSDGKSSASINDVPISATLLREVGDMLVEIQGQFEGRGLLDVATHIGLLDRAANHGEALGKLQSGWDNWVQAQRNLAHAKHELEKARAEEEWLRDAVEQLDLLAPHPGEEAELSLERERLSNVGRIGESLTIAEDSIFGEAGAQNFVGRALAAIEKAAPLAGGLLDPVKSALERTSAEIAEASAAISSAGHALEADPARLQSVDDRLHEIRQQARKHDCTPDDLPELHGKLAASLAGIEDSAGALAALADNERQWRDYYRQVADVVAAGRSRAAKKLDAIVGSELPPLKLDGATFQTVIRDLPLEQFGPLGTQQVRFEASTNQGMKAGPIDRIASGGELARFLLALKVALEGDAAGRTLIFDEVDSGVGGAVAAAVGERLARLGQSTQSLVVTHSPQVAAKGNHHMKIAKTATDAGVISGTQALSRDARTEEIARMLAGEQITNEARAAAAALLAG
ncbi:DNA repair protein RecN [Alphaproteobacteria bacterium]|jgi:DNA repair protein RecN (Recombination protein N)|nr:DNA repair protein RecN [Alphaproteobacteria bacterium]